MSLCELLDLGYAFLAEGAESMDKLDDELGLNEREVTGDEFASLIADMGGEIGLG